MSCQVKGQLEERYTIGVFRNDLARAMIEMETKTSQGIDLRRERPRIEFVLHGSRQVHIVPGSVRPKLTMVSVLGRMTVTIEGKEYARNSEQDEYKPNMSLFQDRAK